MRAARSATQMHPRRPDADVDGLFDPAPVPAPPFRVRRLLREQRREHDGRGAAMRVRAVVFRQAKEGARAARAAAVVDGVRFFAAVGDRFLRVPQEVLQRFGLCFCFCGDEASCKWRRAVWAVSNEGRQTKQDRQAGRHESIGMRV